MPSLSEIVGTEAKDFSNKHDARQKKTELTSWNSVLKSISLLVFKNILNQKEISKFVIKCAFKRTDNQTMFLVYLSRLSDPLALSEATFE